MRVLGSLIACPVVAGMQVSSVTKPPGFALGETQGLFIDETHQSGYESNRNTCARRYVTAKLLRDPARVTCAPV